MNLDKHDIPLNPVAAIRVEAVADDGLIIHKHIDTTAQDRINWARRMDPDGNNGFSAGRTMRHVASIPADLFFALPELADDAELSRFLRRNPELCTVGHATIGRR